MSQFMTHCPGCGETFGVQVPPASVRETGLLAELDEAYQYVARCNLAEATDDSRAWLIRAAARRKGSS